MVLGIAIDILQGEHVIKNKWRVTMKKEKKKKGGKAKWVIIAVVVLAVISAMADDSSSKGGNTVKNSNVQIDVSKAEAETDIYVPVSASTEEQIVQTTGNNTISELPVAENNTALTQGQKNALKSAESYLNFAAFSYEGLIKQLEFEKYSHEEAVYAADNCGADWKEQALKSAKSYLDYTAFSYEGLIKQLEFEEYSHEEAVYAADNCGADWKEQAVKSAASYLEYSSFSREGLIDQLKYEGFTNEEATYGASANGY